MDIDWIENLVRVREATRSGEARRIRQQAGVTQTEVATAVGVSRACVHHWEKGTRRPTGAAAQRYAQLLDLLAPRQPAE